MPLQLGLGLNRRLGGFNPFTPNHLNPHLLFDTRTSMLGELESPTLDLDAAVPSSLDVITATRSGVATYTDVNGVIQSADPNTVRVDYTQGEELTPTVYQRVGYTDFSSGWNKTKVTEEDGDGYDGQVSKVLTVTGDNIIYRQNSPTEAGVVYTASIYARLISGTGTLKINHQNSPSGSDTAVSITSEWQRFEVSFIGLAGTTSVGIRGMLTGDVIEVSSLQVEEGTTASDFVPNTTGSPKFITGATFGPRVPMMLIEPSAENLVTQTDFSNWVQASFTTLTEGAGYSGQPSKIFEATNGTNRVFRSNTFSTTAGTSYTGSFWIRRVSGTGTINLVHQYSATANIVNITSELSEEWTFVERTFLGNASSGDVHFGVWVSSQGDAVEIAMPQVEIGTVATSFIPTSGSTVTRNADNLVIDGTAFTDFYNATEGTVYVEYQMADVSGYSHYVFRILGSQTASLISGNGDSRFNNGFAWITGLGTLTNNQLHRTAASLKASDHEASTDGGVVKTDSNGMLSGAHKLELGQNLGGHLKRLIYWPTHSSSL